MKLLDLNEITISCIFKSIFFTNIDIVKCKLRTISL